MIFLLKFIFAWILLIPQLTGNVFNLDFDRIFAYFLLWVHLIRYLFKLNFILTAADCCAFQNAYGV